MVNGSGWEPLHYGMDAYVQTIYIDSVNSKVYAGGYFHYADSIRANNIAAWDGVKWDSVGSGIQHSLYNFAITNYQGLLYSDGWFTSTQFPNFGGRYSNSVWDTLGFGVNGPIYQIKEINGELFFSGQFSQAGGSSCLMLAKYDGTNWSCLNFPYEVGGRVEDFLLYNDTLILGGVYDDIQGGVNVSYFDGINFQILGHRIYGSIAGIHAMTIYNGDLYVGGYFLSSAGNEGNHIMRWDGTTWYDVGGGTDNEIFTLNVYNDELYVGGVFEYAGGVHTGNLAKWDGANWSQVTPSIISSVIYDIQFYNDEIYIGGAFRYVDSIPVNFIAKYALHTGINDLQTNNQLSVYPNPSANKLNIEISAGNIQKITIYDLTGKQIRTISCNTSKQEIDISTLSPGLYFLDAICDQLTFRKRFIKN